MDAVQLKNALYNAILGWYDDAMVSYHGIDDEEFVNRVCNITGITEKQYKEVMGI